MCVGGGGGGGGKQIEIFNAMHMDNEHSLKIVNSVVDHCIHHGGVVHILWRESPPMQVWQHLVLTTRWGMRRKC